MSHDPVEVAHFLKQTAGLDYAMMGDYLSDPSDTCKQVRACTPNNVACHSLPAVAGAQGKQRCFMNPGAERNAPDSFWQCTQLSCHMHFCHAWVVSRTRSWQSHGGNFRGCSDSARQLQKQVLSYMTMRTAVSLPGTGWYLLRMPRGIAPVACR